MPLTAKRSDGTRVVAPDLSVPEMAALRGLELMMQCCGSTATVVIPSDLRKIQKHFRHHPLGTSPADHWCQEFDNRSPEHIRLQEAVYRHAVNSGWHAEIEAWGPNRDWIANVLLTPPWLPRPPARLPLEGRIAIEIQLSPQSPEENLHRYNAA